MMAISRLTGQTLGAIGVAFLFRTMLPSSAAPLLFAVILTACAAALSLRRIAR